MSSSQQQEPPLSLHDALPIFAQDQEEGGPGPEPAQLAQRIDRVGGPAARELHAPHGDVRLAGEEQGQHLRSEEHTSELQSLRHLVCRLLLEKKETIMKNTNLN